MGPCGLHWLKNGRERGVQKLRGPRLLNSCGGNNGAVALATRGGLSLGLKAESGKRCPKKGRLGTEEGSACSQSACAPRQEQGPLPEQMIRVSVDCSPVPLRETG